MVAMATTLRTKKVLLLDYDGVVLRNNVANNLVAKRAGLYTRNVISMKNNYMVDNQAATDMCFNLYKGFGHTLLGIQAIGLNDPNVCLRNYNRFVYSHIDYDELRLTNNDMKDVKKVVELCREKNVSTYMFSNSPKVWIKQTLGYQQQELAHDIADVKDILNLRDDDATMLKPLPAIYDLIDHMFSDCEIIFVDDSACNFQYTLSRPNWTNVLFGGLNCKLRNRMHMIDDLNKLETILTGK
jgi:FMN phosphatase YigB (HAD superfamily)